MYLKGKETMGPSKDVEESNSWNGRTSDSEQLSSLPSKPSVEPTAIHPSSSQKTQKGMDLTHSSFEKKPRTENDVRDAQTSSMAFSRQISDAELAVLKDKIEAEDECPEEGNLISTSWFFKFSRYVSHRLFAGVSPGPIDNRDLMENGALKDNLIYKEDFFAVDDDEWNLLESKFGVVDEHQRIRPQSHLNSIESECTLPSPPPMNGANSSRLPLVLSSQAMRQESTVSSGSPLPEKQGKTPGVLGLRNLGNTCFMNSALQCLSNTLPLTSYFLSEAWKQELNPENPLGMHGEVAEAYGQLVHQLWACKDVYQQAVSPHAFKSTIGRFNSTFMGYSQQDSQELLNFLLDGLHEDLNRIKKKPYVEMPDMANRSEEEIALKSWEVYRMRNDSVIVDLFQGEYKSRVECTVCHNSSLTFDPYMFLSVPVPETRQITVSFCLMSLAREGVHIKTSITVPRSAFIRDLKAKIAVAHQIPESSLVVIEVFQQKIYKLYHDQDKAGNIMASDTIYVLDVPKTATEDLYTVQIPVYFRLASPSDGQSASIPSFRSSSSSDLFGIPLFVSLPSTTETDNAMEVDDKRPLFRQVFKMVREQLESTLAKAFPIQFGSMSSDECFSLSMIQGSPSGRANRNSHFVTQSFSRFYQSGWTYSYGNTTITEAMVSDTQGSEDDMSSLPDLDLNGEVLFVMEWKEAAKAILSGESANAESVHDLTMFKPQGSEITTSDHHQASPAAMHTITLNDCLKEYTKEELLDEQDTWYCPKCKEHQRIRKKIDIWTVPEILVFHLKRFSNERSAFRSLSSDKIDCLVDFPVQGLDLNELALSPYQKKTLEANGQSLKYDLFAVSNHFGGLGGGHYTAFGKNPLDGQWYNFDDSHVSACNESDVKTKSAYLLFYRRAQSAGAQNVEAVRERINHLKSQPQVTSIVAPKPNIFPMQEEEDETASEPRVSSDMVPGPMSLVPYPDSVDGSRCSTPAASDEMDHVFQ